jgi:dephospho-CoA kinase
MPALAEIAQRFGSRVLREGALDRPALADLVFRDDVARRDLEAILHPRVYRAIAEWFDALSRTPPATGFAIADVPLLYETDRAQDFDVVVVAACRPDQQIARLRSRDGLSEDQARERLAAQWPIDRKAARADLVVNTSGSLEETEQQARIAWNALVTEAQSRALPR